MSEPTSTKLRVHRNESGIGTMSVRALLALILVCAVVALAWRTPELAKDVVVLASVAVTFFFAQKPPAGPPAQPPAPPAS